MASPNSKDPSILTISPTGSNLLVKTAALIIPFKEPLKPHSVANLKNPTYRTASYAKAAEEIMSISKVP